MVALAARQVRPFVNEGGQRGSTGSTGYWIWAFKNEGKFHLASFMGGKTINHNILRCHIVLKQLTEHGLTHSVLQFVK